MNCEKVKELLYDYIEGELDEINAEAVSQHLTECEECKKEYESLLGMTEAIRDAGYEKPEDLHQVIMERVKSEKRKIKIAKIIKRVTYIAATAAMFTIVVSTLLTGLLINGIMSSGNKAPADKGEINNVPGSDWESPSQIPQKDETININADTVFIYVGENSPTFDNLNLTEIHLSRFSGVWESELRDGWRITLEISEDASVVVCISDPYGIEYYYDGMLTFKNDEIYLSQSDGNTVCEAKIKAAIKEGRLLIDIVSGKTPWFEVM